MPTAATIRITCHQKGRDARFEADVEPDCTGQEIVAGLVSANYLVADADYTLFNARTGAEISPSGSLKDFEVRDGDVVSIAKGLNGAGGRPCSA